MGETRSFKLNFVLKILTISIFVVFFNSIAAVNLDKISEIFSANPLQANFEQSKNIAALSSPLRTKGGIWMSESNQLVWQVTFPIKSTLVIGDKGFTQYDSNDMQTQQSNNDYTLELSLMFLNITKGDLKELQEKFNIHCDCLNSDWTLTLLPKENALKNILEEIKIHGSKKMERFSYKEQNGDETLIQLIPTSIDLSQQLSRYLN